jgi:hypothetical protein
MKLRPATFVVAGVAAGALLAAIVNRYTAGPPLPKIPLPALTAIIAASAALLGVTIERIFELFARREERRAKLLQEVYFEAWDSLQRDLTLSLGLASASDPKVLQAQLEQFRKKSTAYASKVYTTGSLETIRAFDELRRGVMKAGVSFATFQLQQMLRRSFREELDQEISGLVDKEQTVTDENERAEIESTLKEKRRKVTDLLREELEDVQRAVHEAVKAGLKFEERLPAAILSARRDLGFSGLNEKDVSDYLNESAKRTAEVVKPLVSFMDKVGELVTVYFPKPEKTLSEPKGDESSEKSGD